MEHLFLFGLLKDFYFNWNVNEYMNTFRQAGEDINVLEYDDTQDNGLPTMMIMQEY